MTRRLLVLLAIVATPSYAADYQLFFLGGQSNMDGYGHVSELPEAYRGVVSGVRIFHGPPVQDGAPDDVAGVWASLQPGHGAGFASDDAGNKLSDRFGPELTFGARLIAVEPGAKVALVKYSFGGTALDRRVAAYGNWDPDFDGNNQYDFALATLRNALSVTDIDGDGEADRLVPKGIIWMQGESDAFDNPLAAADYEANLKRIIDLLRAALRFDDLPVVIGMITDSGMAEDGTVMDFAKVVQAAQQRFVESDGCAALVTETETYGYPENDAWHYDTDGYVKMGVAFADAIVALPPLCGGE
jgi:hypothetical protein